MDLRRLHANDVFDASGLVIALGFFDGMHTAHVRLLETAVAVAKERGKTAALYTFSTHVLSHLRREPFFHLTSLSEKAAYAERLGFAKCIVFEVDDALVELEPERFIERFLLGAEDVVIGFDYSFGRFGRGNAELLQHDGRFPVTVVPEIAFYGKKIGSSRIREALAEGALALATRLLGHPYRIEGEVGRGKGRGKILGFPTANVDYDGYFLPRQGVYATRTWIGGKAYASMTNIGDNPTFAGNRITLEVNVFQFRASLYGERIAVEFLAFVRDEAKYDSTAVLIDQMHHDERTVRSIFEKEEW
ncbi:MAG: riboflavin biosynthesis protein RibF [Tenericutes bacterium GWF2_57_13]|nr:MAG: riboflavin biosynthesis protein RibF [Tenericutes bacterium GWF2_57_13]